MRLDDYAEVRTDTAVRICRVLRTKRNDKLPNETIRLNTKARNELQVESGGNV